jgi:hypothetical protein
MVLGQQPDHSARFLREVLTYPSANALYDIWTHRVTDSEEAIPTMTVGSKGRFKLRAAVAHTQRTSLLLVPNLNSTSTNHVFIIIIFSYSAKYASMPEISIPKIQNLKPNPFAHFTKQTARAPILTVLDDTLANEMGSGRSSVRKKRKHPDLDHPVMPTDAISSAENPLPFPPKQQKKHCIDHAKSEFPVQLPRFDVLLGRTDSHGWAASSPPVVTQQSQVCNGFLGKSQIFLPLKLSKSHRDHKLPKD